MQEFAYDISDCLKVGLRPDHRVRMLPKPVSLVRCLNMRPEIQGLSSRNRPLDPFTLVNGVGLGSVIASTEGGYGGGGPAGVGPAVDSGDLHAYSPIDPDHTPSDYGSDNGDPSNNNSLFTPPGIYGREGTPTGSTPTKREDDIDDIKRYGKWITADHNLESSNVWELGSRCGWSDLGISYNPPVIAASKVKAFNVTDWSSETSDWTWTPGISITSVPASFGTILSLLTGALTVGTQYTVSFSYSGKKNSEDPFVSIYFTKVGGGVYHDKRVLEFMPGGEYSGTLSYTIIPSEAVDRIVINSQWLTDVGETLTLYNIHVNVSTDIGPGQNDPNGYIIQKVSHFLRPMPEDRTILKLSAYGYPTDPTNFAGSVIDASLVMGSSSVSLAFFRKYMTGTGYSLSFWDMFSCPLFYWNDDTGVLEMKLTFKTPYEGTTYTPNSPILYLTRLGVMTLGVKSWEV